MTYEVELHTGGKIRAVTVPDDVVEYAHYSGDTDATAEKALLDAIYRYGQNENCLSTDRAQNLSSISVGDVIRFPGGRRFRIVAAVGFEQILAKAE